ncbi:hypothetical protein EYF80_052855 [Liparis tanakae]|uniref:Uncharacterized protein n=1 Tax=Liparis tanakae TaxID=230148 RepID=A0A4Z2F845_9TELE|nr:hypothetical protein EYF80_052855 [Liparis tanakae]
MTDAVKNVTVTNGEGRFISLMSNPLLHSECLIVVKTTVGFIETQPQHGRVRRRSPASSTRRGSSVKTYRKASTHRKKPKLGPRQVRHLYSGGGVALCNVTALGEPDMWRDTQLLKRLFNLQLGQVGCYGNTKRNQRLERGARKRSRRKKEDVRHFGRKNNNNNNNKAKATWMSGGRLKLVAGLRFLLAVVPALLALLAEFFRFLLFVVVCRAGSALARPARRKRGNAKEIKHTDGDKTKSTPGSRIYKSDYTRHS